MKINRNNIEIYKFDYSDTNKFEKALAIRTEVFVKEQNVPPDLEYDGKDNLAIHFLVIYNNNPVATARLMPVGSEYKLERFAVVKDIRGGGMGKILMTNILSQYKAEEIYFHSQEDAVEFYKRMGYCTEGDEFYEAGIKHYLMKYKQKNNSSGKSD